ncbi:MAG: isoprenylcysteine carboxylmethyltransferase family protein [Bacteroidetes bacterium]|nr:isoprenylcysteine carboxylmethyltransferase family protein [Bacteroidota bacterium]
MIKLGNFFFRHRNYLFPVFYILMFIPYAHRITQNYSLMLTLGLTVLILGQSVRMLAIGLVYIKRGGKNRRIYAEGLVTEGLFSHSRNPMYVGNVTMILGMGIMSNSYLYLLLVVPFFYFIYECIIRAEENYLRGQYGKDFEKYCANVPRWLPNLKGIGNTLTSQKFDFKKMFYKEYNTTFVWMLGAILVSLFNFYLLKGETFCVNHQFYFISFFVAAAIFYVTVRALKKSERRAQMRTQQA